MPSSQHAPATTEQRFSEVVRSATSADHERAAVLEKISAGLKARADELARLVDENWTPPVTASARLVSIIDDAAQHLGQAAYIRGIAS